MLDTVTFKNISDTEWANIIVELCETNKDIKDVVKEICTVEYEIDGRHYNREEMPPGTKVVYMPKDDDSESWKVFSKFWKLKPGKEYTVIDNDSARLLETTFECIMLKEVYRINRSQLPTTEVAGLSRG